MSEASLKDRTPALIVSIDVGFSFVKATSSHHPDTIIVFPSTAVDPAVAPTNFDGEIETDVTVVDGEEWVIGLPRQESFNPPLQADFCQSPEYKALVAEALRRLDVDLVDYLVLGLPSEHFRSGRRHTLEADFSDKTISINETPVSVSKAYVVSQPLGAVAAKMAEEASTEEMGELLVVDIGHFTTDVEVVTAENKLDPTSVLSSTLAMSRVWKELVNRLPVPADPDQIAAKITAGKNTSIVKRGQTVDLEPYLDASVTAIASSLIADIKSRIGNFERIGELLLVGGGAKLFEPHFRANCKIRLACGILWGLAE